MLSRKFDPNKPTYQTNGLLPDFLARTHPGLSVVIVPTPDAQDLIRAREMQRGQDMMFYGVIVAIACAVIHGAIKSSYPALKPFSKFLEWGIVGGVLSIVSGLIYKKVTQYETWIFLAIAVAVCGFLLYRFRDWSISHIFRNPNPKPSQDHRDVTP
jgi:hypothetical protein